jgi:hypothetical protein
VFFGVGGLFVLVKSVWRWLGRENEFVGGSGRTLTHRAD